MTKVARVSLGAVHTHTHTHTHTQVNLANGINIIKNIGSYLSVRVFVMNKNYARDG